MYVVLAISKDKEDGKVFVDTMGFCETRKEANDEMEALHNSDLNELLDYYGHDSAIGRNLVKNSHIEDDQAWTSFNGNDRSVHFLVLGEHEEQYLG